MSPALSDVSRDFYDGFCVSQADYLAASRSAQEFVEQAIADAGIEFDSVSSRPKSPPSLLKKLRSKQYANPATDLTDSVGVRVAVYYRDGVDASVDAIRARITIDEARSVDRRQQLSVYEFGYRSVHLIARLGDLGLTIPDSLENVRFEIQIRSVLEHAWAEIEHEVVYKSGVAFSDETLRNFAAVAGTLELMDGHFEGFRDSMGEEVDRRATALRESNAAWATELDAAAVVAVFEQLAPGNPGWRHAAGLPPHSARLVLEALRTCGLTTGHSVRLAFQSSELGDRAATFAVLSGIATEEVSHLALAALLTGLQQHFPRADFVDLFGDPILSEALA